MIELLGLGSIALLGEGGELEPEERLAQGIGGAEAL